MELAWTRVYNAPADTAVFNIAVSPDGTKVSVDLLWGPVCIVDIASGARTTVPIPGDTHASVIAWHPDGTHIAAALTSGVVVLFDCATQEMCKLPDSFWGVVLAWTSDGTTLATANDEKIITMQPLAKPGDTREYPHMRAVTDPRALVWSPSGKSIAMACPDGLYILEDLDAKRPRSVWAPMPGILGSLAWDATKQTLAGVSYRSGDRVSLVVCDTQEHYTVRNVPGYTEGNAMAWDCRGTPLAAVTDGYDGHSVYNMHTGVKLAHAALPERGILPRRAAWSRDGSTLAIGGPEYEGVYVCRLPPTISALGET